MITVLHASGDENKKNNYRQHRNSFSSIFSLNGFTKIILEKNYGQSLVTAIPTGQDHKIAL